jgi:nicotinamidase-related amidase
MTVRGLDNGEHAALLVSECQQAMTVEAYRDQRDELARQVREQGIIPAISELAASFRGAGAPVIHSHLVPRDDWVGFSVNCALAGILKRTGMVREGHPGSKPHPGFIPQSGDFVVRRRTGLTSFHGTEIDALLRAMQIETVVIVGVSTNVAVQGSTIEAVNRGYNVVIPADCVAGVGDGQWYVLESMLPLLATITDRKTVAEALSQRSE